MPSGEAGLQTKKAHRSAILPVDVASRQPLMIGVVCTFTIPGKSKARNTPYYTCRIKSMAWF